MQRNRSSALRSQRIASLGEGGGVGTSPRRAKERDGADDNFSLPSLSSRSRSHSTGSVDIEEVKHKEVEAQQRVAKLRAQLARAERLEREQHVEAAHRKRRDQAIAGKTEEAAMLAKCEGLQPLSYSEVQPLETLFNERLGARYHEATRLYGDEDSCLHWLCGKVQKHQETVTLFAFILMLRELLGLSEAELPESQVLRLWLTSLKPIPKPKDTNAATQVANSAPPVKPPSEVTLRAIVDFFRRGGSGCSPSKAEQAAGRRERLASGDNRTRARTSIHGRHAWHLVNPKSLTPLLVTLGRPRLLPIAEKRAAARSVRDDLTQRLRAPAMDPSVVHVPKASKAEVRALAEMMNAQLAVLFAPNERTFYRLFKYMDSDGSEMIEFDEFETMVRRQLQLGSSELPHERLVGLWRAIDADGSGRVCQGEWGRFMRFGCAEVCDPDSWIKMEGAAATAAAGQAATPRRTRISQGGNPMADAQARLRARRARQRDRDMDDSAGDVARRVKESARGLGLEAERLEALIREKEQGARGRR